MVVDFLSAHVVFAEAWIEPNLKAEKSIIPVLASLWQEATTTEQISFIHVEQMTMYLLCSPGWPGAQNSASTSQELGL
jgi:hypothetical protein